MLFYVNHILFLVEKYKQCEKNKSFHDTNMVKNLEDCRIGVPFMP